MRRSGQVREPGTILFVVAAQKQDEPELVTEAKALNLRLILDHLDAALVLADAEDEPMLGAKLHDCLITARRCMRAIDGEDQGS